MKKSLKEGKRRKIEKKEKKMNIRGAMHPPKIGSNGAYDRSWEFFLFFSKYQRIVKA